MRRTIIPAITLVGALLALMTSPSWASTPRGTHKAAFPVTVQSGDGTVQIPSRPTRILSLSASATQMLYAIGSGSQVVGVDKYSTWPPKAPRTKFTGYESNAEDYLPGHPDLVVLAFNSGHLVAQLQKLHIPTLLLPPAATIAAAEAQVSELGRATGHASGAARTNATIDRDVSDAVASARGRGKAASYYLEIDQTYYSATSNTFIGALFSRFGMRNIADKARKSSSSYPQLSAEYVLKANPDYVFLADTICCGQSAKTFAGRPGFSHLRAVGLKHVIAMNDSVASEWGPHSLEAFLSVIVHVLDGRAATSTSS